MRKTSLLLSLSLLVSLTAIAQQRGASVISVAPSFGPVGTVVSIRGSGFLSSSVAWVEKTSSEQPPGWVSFNGTPGEVFLWADDLISVRVPAGASSGPLRVVFADTRARLNAGEFEVYYSTPGDALEAPAARYEGGENGRLDQPAEHDRRDNQPGYFDEWPSSLYLTNPWFSGLSPGERTFFGEGGASTFWLRNRFSLGRSPGFVTGGFREGFFVGPRLNSRRGFGNFGILRPFFLDFSNHGRGRVRTRPFFFFWR